MIKKQNQSKNHGLLISVLVLSIILGYAYVRQPALANQNAERKVSDKSAVTQYSNSDYGFSISIPKVWKQDTKRSNKNTVIFTSDSQRRKETYTMIFRGSIQDAKRSIYNPRPETINKIPWVITFGRDIDGARSVSYSTSRNGTAYVFTVHLADRSVLRRVLESFSFTAVTQPFIKLKTDMGSVPNAVVLHPDNTFKITWDSKGVSNVRISFLAGGHEFDPIADSVPASQGYLIWTVPDVSVTSPGGFGGNFRIAVSDVSNDSIKSISTAFSIMP